MQRIFVKQRLMAALCLLMLIVSLLLAACGSYSSPGSSPNGTPQATPTNGGYSIIVLFENEIQLFLVTHGR